ncbi:MAG: FAD-binding oxidoreductase [Acidobacteriales bacterium]|nr:FAD-binding oxidoreductase [Terriglobales bacterium]
MDRRLALLGGLAGLGGCAVPRTPPRTGLSIQDIPPPLAPIRAHKDRIFDITVCLRPFRAQGPRLNTETIGDTLVVHNYGHGGSGWSLSWGSGTIAVQKALANSPKEIAVLGCGALGITSAILAQRAGAKVTIYCKELLQQARSARATGGWTPDSRIALTEPAGPQFAELWEQMARTSWKTYRDYLGLPGDPVVFSDRYALSDIPFQEAHEKTEALNSMGFAGYMDRIADITPRPQLLPPGANPFPVKYVRRSETLQFNLRDYAHTLLNDFRLAGGEIVMREFHSPNELTQLKEKVVINCTGYGARSLWKDDSVVPVRGQIAWLIPQAEVTYGLNYRDAYFLSRTDGIVMQYLQGGDAFGYGNDQEVADRVEAEKGIGVLEELYARMS